MRKTLLLLIIGFWLLAACSQSAVELDQESESTEQESQTSSEQSSESAEQSEGDEELNPSSGPKKLTFVEWDWVDSGWAMETDDAYAMTRWGILETLVKVDFDGQMVPHLAESWEQTDENTWEFKLRSDVTFQNGEPFNANAVANALNFLINVDTPPRGFDPANIKSIEAVGDDTVVIRTVESDALMPNRLTSPGSGILAPSAYKDNKTVDAFGTGTGPFILIDEVPDQKVTLVKNENYWGGPVNLDEAEVLWVPDSSVRAGMVRSGEADLARLIPIAQIPILESDPNISMTKVLEPRTQSWYLNTSSGVTSDPLVRKALMHAIDKQAIVDAILEGVGIPAATAFNPSEAWFNSDVPADTFDPELAKQLLAEAGYSEGELTLSIWTYPTRPELPATAVALQGMLADVGVNAEIRVAQYSALEPDLFAGEYETFVLSRGHLLDTYDPEGFLLADYSCEGSFNLSQYCNEEVDALLEEARVTSDPDARFDLYRQIQAILYEEAVTVFLNHPETRSVYRNHVLNYQPHPLEQYALTPQLDVSQ